MGLGICRGFVPVPSSGGGPAPSRLTPTTPPTLQLVCGPLWCALKERERALEAEKAALMQQKAVLLSLGHEPAAGERETKRRRA